MFFHSNSPSIQTTLPAIETLEGRCMFSAAVPHAAAPAMVPAAHVETQSLRHTQAKIPNMVGTWKGTWVSSPERGTLVAKITRQVGGKLSGTLLIDGMPFHGSAPWTVDSRGHFSLRFSGMGISGAVSGVVHANQASGSFLGNGPLGGGHGTFKAAKH